jgi:peptide/nickel transport system substrate-binding protein
MHRHKSRLIRTFAAICACTLFIGGCGSSATGNNADSGGEPVAGGVLNALQSAEPRTLDPAGLNNVWAANPLLGNALYGELMINNLDTFEVEYKMATAFTTNDGGTTFSLTLRPGLMFTDGTPLDAAAVKFNWDRLRNPALASASIRVAGQVADTEVVDPSVLKVILTQPNPHFAQGLVATSLNWIASPTALQKGAAEFDKAPVGAGPFRLTKWTRQDVIELEKNTEYWDAPKPYLDGLTIRTAADSTQRFNAITTGAADLSSESNRSTLANAENAGVSTEIVTTSGGQYFAANVRSAPFDDIRARQAVALAIDPETINSSVYNGQGLVPTTLFDKSSPFFTDTPLPTPDKAAAQALFDDLATDGKPLSFTFLAFPGLESKMSAESLQTQLSAFDNVEVKIETSDYAGVLAKIGTHNFDMTIGSVDIQDPDYAMWASFHGASTGNFTGINDPELNEALDAGRTPETTGERTAAYARAEERLSQLHPALWYVRPAPAAMWSKDVNGVQMYTLGSIMPEELWMTQ